MRSVMDHTFSEVPKAEIPRSSFNRSHGHKTTFDADYLVPILVDEVLPGDTFNVNANFFARLATPLHPIMDNLYLETFFFFVPYRLVWENWTKMHGEQDDPDDTISYTTPAISSSTTEDLTGATVGDLLLNYMGLPYKNSVDLSEISALPLRCYNLIFNTWFRDENLHDPATVSTTDGPDSTAVYILRQRMKRHDYFTSSLPWPLKGGTDVSIPLGDSAPIENTAPNTDFQVTANDRAETAKLYREASGNIRWNNTGSGYTVQAIELAGYTASHHEADLSSATAATINQLRLAFQTQRLLERDARAGSRYVEHIKAHFGVTIPDFRLQRPEFLGGGSTPINMTPVAQQSAQTTPVSNDTLGHLAAYGTAGGTHGFVKSFVEHGVILGIANVRGDITYQQGLERFWSKSTRYDYYYPVLAQIGEQAVLNSEIYYTNTSTDDDVWGYQERYAEYRYKPSRLSGLFQSDHGSTLDVWHLSEDFSSLPTLGETFIKSNTGVPLDRAIAIPSEPHIIADFYFDMKCARPMPLFGVPGNLDHF